MTDSLAFAHALLVERVSSDRHARSEDPADPDTVQAMQIALHVPKSDPPHRTDLLEAAARAVVSVCLAEEVATDEAWRTGLEDWYDHLIRKVARRARNKAWDDVQAVSGITMSAAGAQARAFVPTAVSRVPDAVRKLQIHGTELPTGESRSVYHAVPTILSGFQILVDEGRARVAHSPAEAVEVAQDIITVAYLGQK